jgi:hypothetical protein
MPKGSPIIWPDETPEPPNEASSYTQTARSGARAPHVWLSDGRSTLDLFGRGFVLVRIGLPAPDVTPLKVAAVRRRLPLSVIDIDEPAVEAAYEQKLVLVRPDGHVAWRDDVLSGLRMAEPSTARSASGLLGNGFAMILSSMVSVSQGSSDPRSACWTFGDFALRAYGVQLEPGRGYGNGEEGRRPPLPTRR